MLDEIKRKATEPSNALHPFSERAVLLDASKLFQLQANPKMYSHSCLSAADLCHLLLPLTLLLSYTVTSVPLKSLEHKGHQQTHQQGKHGSFLTSWTFTRSPKMLEPLCVVQQQRLCGIPTKLASQQQGISAGNSLGFSETGWKQGRSTLGDV